MGGGGGKQGEGDRGLNFPLPTPCTPWSAPSAVFLANFSNMEALRNLLLEIKHKQAVLCFISDQATMAQEQKSL